MPTYGKNNFKESNVNYLNKDFTALKTSLMNYAKSYFPNTYRDFNETSPGMMLLEMNAYVGDVLSFYVDQQYREMLLPLAEERRNIINIASMLGYKVKPIVPSYVDLSFRQTLSAEGNDSSKVDYSTCGVFDNIQVQTENGGTIFETLDVVDFTISSSADVVTIASRDTDGLATTYDVTRVVKAVSGETKTKVFVIGAPEKFKKLTIVDTNVIDIISCIDSNGNEWYEVDYLAQDKVPISTHYTQDESRNTAYSTSLNNNVDVIEVPYSLQYIKTSKRFTRETNVDNTTSLVFGNGVLKNGQVVDDGFIDVEQVGITIPGQYGDLNDAIDPLLGDEYSTLGETPNNTTLTITYRVGGGINSNIQSGTVNTILSGRKISGDGQISDLSVSNLTSARGGKNEESIDEIREKAKAFFTTQNRCVTKEDYEARIMNMSAKFGNVAKVYVTRSTDSDDGYNQDGFNAAVATLVSQLQGMVDGSFIINGTEVHSNLQFLSNELSNLSNTFTEQQLIQYLSNFSLVIQDLLGNQVSEIQQTELSSFELSSINIYLLAYNERKELVGNPISSYDTTVSDFVPTTMKQNVKKYLDNFKILTDSVNIQDGYIVNFGVFFDVIAEQYADKQQVNLRCNDVIKKYFNVDKMQFNQPIYKSQLEYELMGVEGVRSVGHVTISQKDDYHPNGQGNTLITPTYTYSYSPTAGPDLNGDGQPDGGFTNMTGEGYGFKYDFQNALTEDGTIIKPPLTSTPTVFELKNPDNNIQGRVR